MAQRSNQVWTVDFKGWFRTRDGQRVEPLTVRDLFSRYLLTVRLFPEQSWTRTRRVFLRLFREQGYPTVIRTDNGKPFGSAGPAGLTRLSAWWTALGIRVEFIAPGHPEQNGAHEQMHRVLKAETTQPPSGHLRAQQRRLDEDEPSPVEEPVGIDGRVEPDRRGGAGGHPLPRRRRPRDAREPLRRRRAAGGERGDEEGREVKLHRALAERRPPVSPSSSAPSRSTRSSASARSRALAGGSRRSASRSRLRS